MQARSFIVVIAHCYDRSCLKNALRLRPGNVKKSRQGSGRKDKAKTRELLDAKPRISETHESCECTIHDPRGAGVSARNPYAHAA
jgi:hypothetical protein